MSDRSAAKPPAVGAVSEAVPLASEQRSGVRPRFTPQVGGAWIDDDDFIFDAMLKISGDFSPDGRKRYAQWVCDVLNEADKTLPREPRAPNVGVEPPRSGRLE